jgi:calcineurin-like phosphoesterase family protein
MENAIITNWNDCVAPDDIVYVLGDIVFGDDIDTTLKKIAQLNGIKYLAIGNHDTDSKIEKYKEFNIFEDIQFAYRVKVGKNIMYLTHYPTIVANPGDEKRVYNVHGHTHSVFPIGEYANCYNVSPEAHACAPVLLGSIPGALRS